jgi:hypothetical protein
VSWEFIGSNAWFSDNGPLSWFVKVLTDLKKFNTRRTCLRNLWNFKMMRKWPNAG